MDTYWHHLSQDISSEAYNNAEFQIHYLSQFISLTGINILNPEPDDSHTNLGWDPLTRQLYGHTFRSGKKACKMVFDVGSYRFRIITEQEKVLNEFEIVNRSIADITQWWIKAMKKLKSGIKVSKELHYELPDYGYNDASIIRIPSIDILEQWIKLRTLAGLALSDMKLYEAYKPVSK